jgi:hypothetical protein
VASFTFRIPWCVYELPGDKQPGNRNIYFVKVKKRKPVLQLSDLKQNESCTSKPFKNNESGDGNNRFDDKVSSNKNPLNYQGILQ